MVSLPLWLDNTKKGREDLETRKQETGVRKQFPDVYLLTPVSLDSLFCYHCCQLQITEGDVMHWRDKMPKAVREIEFAEYATCREEREVALDCSLGTNPLGSPGCVDKLLSKGQFTNPCAYPGDDIAFKKAISDSWKGVFAPEEVILGTGSIGLIVSLARTFCSPGSVVLGVAPQFPDGPMHFQFAGASFRTVALFPPDYRLDITSLIEAMRGDESIIYLDRPHNPTGQASPLPEVESLAEACLRRNSLLVVDEAYGDFLPPEESAVMLSQRSVIVLRSFSKGRGLAGIRTGYAVVRDTEARTFIRKVAPPFSVSSIAIDIAAKSLDDTGFPIRSIEAIKSVKERVLQTISETPGFSAAATHPQVPILLVSSSAKGDDLYERLMSQGIRAEAGTCFEPLGPESVRIRVPAPGQLDAFLDRWNAATKK